MCHWPQKLSDNVEKYSKTKSIIIIVEINSHVKFVFQFYVIIYKKYINSDII